MENSEPVYIISVAARLLKLSPHTLRKYERIGFILPSRVRGPRTLRLYSEEDMARLRQIKYLVEKLALNLAGVQLALRLSQQLLRLQERAAGSRDGQELQPHILGEVSSMLRTLGVP